LGEIRYIGKTARGLVYRRAQHIYEARVRDRKRYVLHWLRELLAEGLLPEITSLEEVDGADDWQERERFWIAYGRAEGWPLTNIADGGKGFRAMGNCNAAGKRSPEFCQKIAEINKGNRNAAGRTVSQEERSRISASVKAYYRNGGEGPRGEKQGQSKLTADQVREIRRRYAEGGISYAGSRGYRVNRSSPKMGTYRLSTEEARNE
jgi:hypothetical protein